MDLSKVKPLDIDPYLGKVRNRIALVSVELEGAWAKLPPGISAIEHDGSVFNDGNGQRMPPGMKYLGELACGPMLPAAVQQEIHRNHPARVNETCGMHVHMSFDTLYYYKLLMVPEYQKTVLTYLTTWAKAHGDKVFPDTHYIWPRLRGESRFAKEEFWPDAQATTMRKDHDQQKYGHRYTAIHYCGRLSTIECRVLPMFDKVRLGTSAVHELLNVTNACLYVLGRTRPKDKIEGKIEFPDGMTYEETVIETI